MPKTENLKRDPGVTVEIARTFDQIVQAIAIRSFVYMAEQDCPYHEEFDGNDFSGATHLIARIGSEPVGTLRLRWFAEFAKLERVAVKASYRNKAVVTELCLAAAEIASRKGYRQLIGCVQTRLASFWVRYGGARLRQDREPFHFSDYEYVEVVRDLEPRPEALTIDTPPLVLMRPEGAWDEPGILDRSAIRVPKRPAL